MIKIKKIKSIYGIIKYFNDLFNERSLGAYSAQSAFYIFIAMFPFAILLFTVISNLPVIQLDLTETPLNVMPELLSQILGEALEQTEKSSNVLVIIVTSATALWAASKGMRAIFRGLNAACDVSEDRGIILMYVHSTVYTLIFVVMIAATLGLLAFGNIIYDWLIKLFPEIRSYALIVKTTRFLVVLVILTLLFMLMYKFLPNRKIKFTKTFPGAAISAFGWLGYSFVYSIYLNKTDMSSSVYGSMAAIVFLLLWLNFCMSILLFGGVFNTVLQSGKNELK